MPYKDKDQQKQANKVAAQRRRDKSKGMTIAEGMTDKGVTNQGMTEGMTIEDIEATGGRVEDNGMACFGIANFGQPDCACQHCQTVRANGSKHTLNHGAWQPAADLDKMELNRVALPGDADYKGCCVEVDGQWMTKQDSARIDESLKAIAQEIKA